MKPILPVLLAVAAISAASSAAAHGAPQATSGDWAMHAQEDSATLTWSDPSGPRFRLVCEGGSKPELGLLAWVPAVDAGPVAPSGEILLTAGWLDQRYLTLNARNGDRIEMTGRARKDDQMIDLLRAAGTVGMLVRGGELTMLTSSPDDTSVSEFFEWCR